MIAILIVILVLLFLLALISAAEVAFFSLKPHQVKDIRINDISRDDLVAKLLQDPKRLLATILILVNFINVSIVIISTFLTNHYLNAQSSPLLGFLIQVVALTVLILFFGEIMPKVYATQNPIRVAVLMAKPMQFFSGLFRPFSLILINSTAFVDKRLAKKGMNISMSELEEAIDITTNEDTPEEDRKILKSIVNFGETETREIMKGRVNVTAIEKTLSFHHLVKFILDSGYSRMPVYEDTLDKIVGILHIKDLLPFLQEKDDFNWQNLIRPAFFVPENKKISGLLEEFQKTKIHLAVVVDEYGGTSGIVTLEDILEEIVGEINDEFDVESENIMYARLDDQNFIFEGLIPLNDFCRVLEIDEDTFDEVKGESGTLAGLILEMTGHIPEEDEKIIFGRFVFRIEAVDQRSIRKIKVTIANATQE